MADSKDFPKRPDTSSFLFASTFQVRIFQTSTNDGNTGADRQSVGQIQLPGFKR